MHSRSYPFPSRCPAQRLSFLLWIAAAFFCCLAAHSEVTNSTLAFYIVGKEKIEGGRFVGIHDVPKPAYMAESGYIAPKPELAVTNIQDVFHDKTMQVVVSPNKEGKTNWLPPSDIPKYLVVKLKPDDAKLFVALTKRAAGKQVFVMLNNHPLCSWTLSAAFPEGRFDITFSDLRELQKTEDELKKLIR